MVCNCNGMQPYVTVGNGMLGLHGATHDAVSGGEEAEYGWEQVCAC